MVWKSVEFPSSKLQTSNSLIMARTWIFDPSFSPSLLALGPQWGPGLASRRASGPGRWTSASATGWRLGPRTATRSSAARRTCALGVMSNGLEGHSHGDSWWLVGYEMRWYIYICVCVYIYVCVCRVLCMHLFVLDFSFIDLFIWWIQWNGV